jgi:hypothetical protein
MDIKRMTLNFYPPSDARSGGIDHKSTLLTPQKDSVKYFNAHATIATPKTNFESNMIHGSADKGSSININRGMSSGPSNYFSVKSMAINSRPDAPRNSGGFNTAGPGSGGSRSNRNS